MVFGCATRFPLYPINTPSALENAIIDASNGMGSPIQFTGDINYSQLFQPLNCHSRFFHQLANGNPFFTLDYIPVMIQELGFSLRHHLHLVYRLHRPYLLWIWAGSSIKNLER